MKNQIGIAVIGCGYWGGNYIRTLSEMPDAAVVIVCDKSPTSLEMTHSRFPNVKLTTKLEDVLHTDEVEAVVIATDAQSHYATARYFLQAGKHVLLEKPMTTAVSDAAHLMLLAETQGLVLMVGHIYLYNAGVKKVKSSIEAMPDGSLYYMYSRRTNLGPIRNDVDALWDLAPHDISIMNYLVGNTPESVSAIGHNILRNERSDVGFIVLNYPNNILGHVHVSWADPHKVREFVAVAKDKRIVFDEMNPTEPVRIFEASAAVSETFSYGKHQLSIPNGEVITSSIQIGEPLKQQCYHFIDCVLQGTTPFTNGENGLEVVRVMEAVNQSLEHRGAPVLIEKKQSSISVDVEGMQWKMFTGEV